MQDSNLEKKMHGIADPNILISQLFTLHTKIINLEF